MRFVNKKYLQMCFMSQTQVCLAFICELLSVHL